MTPEGLVKRDYRALLDRIGAYRFAPVQHGYGARTLDDLCCIRGRFVAIEGKRKGEKSRKFQSLIAEEIRAAGGLVIEADTAEKVEAQLRAAGLM